MLIKINQGEIMAHSQGLRVSQFDVAFPEPATEAANQSPGSFPLRENLSLSGGATPLWKSGDFKNPSQLQEDKIPEIYLPPESTTAFANTKIGSMLEGANEKNKQKEAAKRKTKQKEAERIYFASLQGPL